MAIIPHLGISVTVHIDKTPTVEYEDPEPLNPKVDRAVTRHGVCNRYIESEENSKYTIVFEVWPRHKWISSEEGNGLVFIVFVDGMLCVQWLVARENLDEGYARVSISGADRDDSEDTVNEFRFRSIDIVESAKASSSQRDIGRAKALGTIRVDVWRVHKGAGQSIENFYDSGGTHNSNSFPQSSSPKKPADTDVSASSQSPGTANRRETLRVAEAAFKGQAISHGTAFEEPIPIDGFVTVETPKTDDDHPFAIFNLKYRSKDDLRKQMIVPRTPSPTPAERIERLTEDEIRKLAMERLAEQNARERNSRHTGRAAKRQHGQASCPSPANNPDNGRASKRLKNGTQIIDLTGV